MCDALATNTTTNSLWLKRNPIGPKGLEPVRRLLEVNKTLTTLDLDNCGILDEGVEVLSQAQGCVLKHLYLDSNGITALGATALSKFLLTHRNVIKSVYVSVNRMGDEGALAIAEALRGSTTLKRLSMSSNRITDAAADQIVDCMLECKSLVILDVGCYKSTFDMGERPNYFTNVLPWIRLMTEHQTLKILDLSMNSMAPSDINVLLSVARRLPWINVYAAPAKGQRDHFSHESFKDKRIQKFIKHPKCVVNIDSMYRNKM